MRNVIHAKQPLFDDPAIKRSSTAVVQPQSMRDLVRIRRESIRIISARGAEPYEQRQYHEDNR